MKNASPYALFSATSNNKTEKLKDSVLVRIPAVTCKTSPTKLKTLFLCLHVDDTFLAFSED